MRKRAVILTTAGAVALAMSVAACGDASDTSTGQSGEAAAQQQPSVPVAEVIVRDIVPSNEFNGSLAAPRSVELRPRVSGQIVSVAVPEGGMVRRGQTLFQIDPRPFQVALDQAVAQQQQAEAQASQAQAELDRAERLVSTGAISRKQFDDATSQRRALQAGVAAARAAVAAARLELSFTRVTAPITGRVDRVLVTEGNVVASVAQAAPLTTIVSVDPLYVEFNIDEATYLASLSAARRDGGTARLPVSVGLMNDDGHPYAATLAFLGNGIDKSAGIIQARAIVPNPRGNLTPGLFARVRLASGEARQTLLIADEAIGSDQDKSFVLVLSKDNKAEYREITTGPIVDGLRVVRSGLAAGDVVIVKGLVRPGMQVSPRRVPMQAPAAPAVPQPAGAEARR